MLTNCISAWPQTALFCKSTLLLTISASCQQQQCDLQCFYNNRTPNHVESTTEQPAGPHGEGKYGEASSTPTTDQAAVREQVQRCDDKESERLYSNILYVQHCIYFSVVYIEKSTCPSKTRYLLLFKGPFQCFYVLAHYYKSCTLYITTNHFENHPAVFQKSECMHSRHPLSSIHFCTI